MPDSSREAIIPHSALALNNSGAHLRVRTARREYHNPTAASRRRLWRVIGDGEPEWAGGWRVYHIAKRKGDSRIARPVLAPAASLPTLHLPPARAESGAIPAQIGNAS